MIGIEYTFITVLYKFASTKRQESFRIYFCTLYGNIFKKILGTNTKPTKLGMCTYVITHTVLPPSPAILWIELGGKSKWLPLNFGYHDFMCTVPILQEIATFLRVSQISFDSCRKCRYLIETGVDVYDFSRV